MQLSLPRDSSIQPKRNPILARMYKRPFERAFELAKGVSVPTCVTRLKGGKGEVFVRRPWGVFLGGLPLSSRAIKAEVASFGCREVRLRRS